MRTSKKNLKHQKECIKKHSGSTSLSYEDMKENRAAALKAVQENKPFRYVTTKEAVQISLKREIKRKQY